MAEWIVVTGIVILMAVALVDARAIWRLHQRCCQLERRDAPAGLRRWQLDGFDPALGLLRWLLRADLLLLLLALTLRAQPLLIVAVLATMALIHGERRLTTNWRRQHCLAQWRDAAERAHR